MRVLRRRDRAAHVSRSSQLRRGMTSTARAAARRAADVSELMRQPLDIPDHSQIRRFGRDVSADGVRITRNKPCPVAGGARTSLHICRDRQHILPLLDPNTGILAGEPPAVGRRPARDPRSSLEGPIRIVVVMRMALSAAGLGPRESTRRIRLASTFVVGYSVIVAATRLYSVVTSPLATPRIIIALAAFACWLPLDIWLVYTATRGRFRRPQTVGLAALAVVVFGALPDAGVSWVGFVGILAGLAVAGLRTPWSLVLYVALAATPAPLAIALGQPDWALYFSLSFPFVSLPVATGIWLVRAAGQLQAARVELAEQAVVRERTRADDELRGGVGAGLQQVADNAGAALRQLDDWAAATHELDVVVNVARATFADAKRIVGRYREVSLRTELDTAVTLLAAAGVDARLELRIGDAPASIDDAARESLRDAIGEILSGVEPPTAVTITAADGCIRIRQSGSHGSRAAQATIG
jgi:two-component system sensor histidine kinase DesK